MLLPTMGVGLEQALIDDTPAMNATLHAFNRFLEDDWGYSYQDRIFAVPMISLADPDVAVAEVQRVLALGARMIHVRPAPVPDGSGGGRSLGHPLHDPVWARIAEANVPVAFHLGDSGYHQMSAMWGGSATVNAERLRAGGHRADDARRRPGPDGHCRSRIRAADRHRRCRRRRGSRISVSVGAVVRHLRRHSRGIPKHDRAAQPRTGKAELRTGGREGRIVTDYICTLDNRHGPLRSCT